jgi:hypothetical protein
MGNVCAKPNNKDDLAISNSKVLLFYFNILLIRIQSQKKEDCEL